MGRSILIIGGDLKSRNQKALSEIKRMAENPKWQSINNPDFIALEGYENIGINEIRELQKLLKLKPFSSQYKFALVTQAEKLTPEAQNALLKTLEEPLEKSVIILTAPDSSWLLPTIVSRCQIIQLPQQSQIILSDIETKKFQETFQKIIKAKVGERLKILEELEITADRQKALEWLDKMTFLVRKLLIDIYSKKVEISPNNHIISPYLNILISLSKTKSYLQANTNTRLTVENLLLNL